VAAHSRSLRRFASGPLHGTALALYFALLPFVVVSKWRLTAGQGDGSLIRSLLAALSVFWLAFLYQLARDVVRLRRGHRLALGGSAWLAGLLVALLSLLAPAAGHAVAPHRAPVTATAPRLPDASPPRGVVGDPRRPPLPTGAAMSGVPMALAAKRRRDQLRHSPEELSDNEVDEAISLLQDADASLLARLAHLVGTRRDGVVRLGDDFAFESLDVEMEPLAVCVVDDGDDGVLLSFAREGGRLRVPEHWSDDVVASSVVVVHEGGRLRVARTEAELLRQLATRFLRSTLVLYLGPQTGIDDALRACAITVEPVSVVEEAAGVLRGTGGPAEALDLTASGPRDGTHDVMVQLLRADPRVLGLREPFTPTLRRRCVEMAAYLALHRREPVTGDRLRTRVLTRADVDASLRTLANTASAVRRSLGVDDRGPRLHPVTSSGLYVTHRLTSDVERFHDLVARSRRLSLDDGAPMARQALELVHGEPLASALRGYEWFLAEGHWARLRRDGEWAALAVHQWALERDDFELAFWALERGRLIDPFSDALDERLNRVPRLREFGSDRPGPAQHEPVGARGAEQVRGPGGGLAK
jgi:hypothetical protein